MYGSVYVGMNVRLYVWLMCFKIHPNNMGGGGDIEAQDLTVR